MKNQTVQLITGGYVKLRYDRANLGVRIFAYIIDMFVLLLISIGIEAFHFQGDLSNMITYILIIFFDMFLELYFSGQTIGKMLLKIKVINSDCQPPTFLQVFYRWIMIPIDFFVGVFFISHNGQRLGDILSGCYVVTCRSEKHDKVNIANEFAYLSPNYKIHYPEVTRLTEEQIVAIQKVLHENRFKGFNSMILEKVKERIKRTSINEPNKVFLQNLLNDYKYIEMSKQKSI